MTKRSEFESFVRRLAAPAEVNRLGADIITHAVDRAAADFSPLVPADYLIKPGDEVLLTIWGSVDADLRLVVDRSGRINIPRVGPVQVAGVRYADLNDTISRRVGQQFRNYQLSATLGQLRGVRVYVTGFVPQPGAYSVSSLSTLTHALLAAGGPSGSGSFRNIELRRAGKVETRFDLYDFLLNGERTGDRIVQADDVIYVGPVGPQVALIGSVNRPAIFELKPGETVADVLRMAGGFNTVADRSRLAVERLEERSSQRVTQIDLPAGEGVAARNGDVLRAFSAVDAALPVGRQTKLVRVEGEVLRPGDYLLPPGSGMSDALAVAGGLTPAAYVFGTEFNRESVRVTQQQNYERALRDLEVAFSKSANTQRVASADEAAAAGARNQSIQRLVDRLRELKPSGRVVLQIDPAAPKLPELALEDGDRIFIPPQATSVGVFGSVYNAGSYLWKQGATANDFLQLAGGPTVGADAQSVFLIRPNGSVVSARQNGSWISGRDLKGVAALPGDTIFVPDELDRTTLTQDLKDWAQILYQTGLSAAAFVAVGK
ncbi:SLBB domain-containing protein [Rivibacter subsaxonicus]|uniref:Protein involved in polysaccharide export with SLBB domain n=1 Tax=Rivibacter subsaxonicus TaxID=457575 RepID=A0A4V2FSR7_9BURK|nr:SLBB domain-containing protein [Rivibacter subsaxonicus]RZT95255.1 protein involved in polysaccharide export with SLBB domain [Rivibacter subsaxonicus]